MRPHNYDGLKLEIPLRPSPTSIPVIPTVIVSEPELDKFAVPVREGGHKIQIKVLYADTERVDLVDEGEVVDTQSAVKIRSEMVLRINVVPEAFLLVGGGVDSLLVPKLRLDEEI